MGKPLSLRQGTYFDPEGKVDFGAFRVTKFIPHIFGNNVYAASGCGATALALLTGKNPLNIPHRKHWSANYVYGYLYQNKFKIADLTLRNITNFRKASYPINAEHVILASIKFVKGQASWVVIYNEMLYHNFEIMTLGPYELVNHPLITACLLQHPSWKSKVSP